MVPFRPLSFRVEKRGESAAGTRYCYSSVPGPENHSGLRRYPNGTGHPDSPGPWGREGIQAKRGVRTLWLERGAHLPCPGGLKCGPVSASRRTYSRTTSGTSSTSLPRARANRARPHAPAMTRPPVSAQRFSLPLARKKCSVHPASLSLNVERCRSPVSLISPGFSSSVAECDITGLQEVQELGGGIHLKERHVGNDKVWGFHAARPFANLVRDASRFPPIKIFRVYQSILLHKRYRRPEQ